MDELYSMISKWLTEGGFENDTRWCATILMISEQSGNILVQKRSSEMTEPDTICVPGGHLEEGEIPSEGAWREFREETGYKGPQTQLEPLDMLETGDKKVFTFVGFLPKEFDAEPLNQWVNEVTWHKWLSLNDILDRDDLHPDFKHCLDGHLNLITNMMNKYEADDSE